MRELYIILTFLFAPELFFVLSLPFTASRQWWLRLVEDSDGDPHHTDGFFIVVLYSAVWCFRFAFIAAWYQISEGKSLIDVIIAFLTAGAALLGVRIFKGRVAIPKTS